MFPAHPFAALFPLIEGEEFAELVASIKANGLREPVTIFERKVLDGRNRERACKVARVKCRYKPLPRGVDPLQFVIDKNLKRRHMTPSQRAYAAAKLATMPKGRPSKRNAAQEAISQSDAAALFGVARASVQRARELQDHGTPELCRVVERGILDVAAGAKAAKLTTEQQRRIVADAEAGRANVVRTVINQAVRAAREHDLGKRQQKEGQQRGIDLIGVFVEDFEWDFETWSRETGMDRHAANHYETATDAHTAEQIIERTKDRFADAASNCVLFMWVPVPHLAVAIDVLRGRGFKYVSHYVWHKPRIITGHWSRVKHEILLIGTRGSPPCPAPGTQEESVLDGPLGRHSAKPVRFLEMIERYYPTLAKKELNCRGPARPGWHWHGNEAEPPKTSAPSVQGAAP
ncbi:MAG: Spo0J and IME4 domain-containing protein [Xanthobacteraceae bacterium]